MAQTVHPPPRPPGYELFFAPLQVSLDPNDLEQIQFAYMASKYGHAKQVRDDGTRYFDHPKAAAWIYIDELGGRDPRVIINLLLHDLAEDTYLLSPYRLSVNFGTEIALDVRGLTKLPKGKETTPEYLGRVVARGPRAILSKLLDRLHNLRNLKSSTAEKRKRQVLETTRYHLKILIPALKECGGEWAEYAKSIEKLIRATLRDVKKIDA
ncbi:MAG: HD domain-containing protein [Patescibacteria group bacterium]